MNYSLVVRNILSKVESENKKKFNLNETIVKAARDLVVNRQVNIDPNELSWKF